MPPQGFRIIDRVAPAEALGVPLSDLSVTHADWVARALAVGPRARMHEWTSSLAVGS